MNPTGFQCWIGAALAGWGVFAYLARAQPVPPAPQNVRQTGPLADRNIVMHPVGGPFHFPGGPVGWLANLPDPDPDSNEPDKAAWQVFIAINQFASTQQTVGGNTTNNAIWEAWADDGLTFPASPNPASPPQWPSTAQTSPLKRLQIPAQLLIRELLQQKVPPAEIKPRVLELQRAHPGLSLEQVLRSQAAVSALSAPLHIELVATGGGEEVRRNQASFNFLITNKLWYRQGLANAFTAGTTIVFPVNAIEIKADWVPIQPAQKSQYHWNYDANGNLYGLVALHIMTKALPNWLWATFEWTGNAGRCDYIGCNDSFGVTPSIVAPASALNQAYPAGTLTPALLSLMSAAGLGAEFQNYRLKGSQTLFANTVGQPTLLGNSVIEKGFVQSSSCITCHGQASVDQAGNTPPNTGFVSFSPLQSSNGPLTPSMFYSDSSPPQLQYLPIDFVWAVFRAQ
jgi:hypothetical protein